MARIQEKPHGVERAPKNEWGYSVSQVDEFLESTRNLYEESEPNMTQVDIQKQCFDLEKNGYDIKAVDNALRRLEDAVVDKLAAWTIAHEGIAEWRAQTEQLALSLIPRAQREKRKLFSRARAFTPAYDVKQVDNFVFSLTQYLNNKLSLGVLSSENNQRSTDYEDFSSRQVASTLFTQRTGHSGYNEGEVDAYLNRAIEVLSHIESTERMNSAEPDLPDSTELINSETSFVQPLIPDYSTPASRSEQSVNEQSAATEAATEVQADPAVTSVMDNSDGSTLSTTDVASVLSKLHSTSESARTEDTESSSFDSISQEEEKIFEDAPASFAPVTKPERGSTAADSGVDYSGLMDTGSIQSVQFHMPKLDDTPIAKSEE